MAIFASSNNLAKHSGHLISRLACDFDAVVAEDWFPPNRQQEIERGDVLGEFAECNSIDRIEELGVEVVNPELVEVAQDYERQAMRDDVTPVIERLVVMLLENFAARFHLDEHAVGPKKIGELFSSFWFGAVAFDQFELRRAGFLRDAKLKRRPSFDRTSVAEGAEEMIQK